MKDRRDPRPISGSSPEPEPIGPQLSLGGSIVDERSRRRIFAAIVAGVVLILLGWAVWNLVDRAKRWLHGLPDYTIPFSEIELVPAPPESSRLDREGLLAKVKERAGISDPISILEQDLEDLRLAFVKYSPWIAKVDRIERVHPRRLIVHAEYREPVARIDLDRSGKRFLAIASDGVVISDDEIRPAFAAKLVRLDGFATIPEGLPGRYLGVDKKGKIPSEITSAIHLAAFLYEKDRAKASSPRIGSINVRYGNHRLLVMTKRKFWFRWNHAPGEETDDELKSAEKWERLIGWEDVNREEKPIQDQTLNFTKDSVKSVVP